MTGEESTTRRGVYRRRLALAAVGSLAIHLLLAKGLAITHLGLDAVPETPAAAKPLTPRRKADFPLAVPRSPAAERPAHELPLDVQLPVPDRDRQPPVRRPPARTVAERQATEPTEWVPAQVPPPTRAASPSDTAAAAPAAAPAREQAISSAAAAAATADLSAVDPAAAARAAPAAAPAAAARPAAAAEPIASRWRPREVALLERLTAPRPAPPARAARDRDTAAAARPAATARVAASAAAAAADATVAEVPLPAAAAATSPTLAPADRARTPPTSTAAATAARSTASGDDGPAATVAARSATAAAGGRPARATTGDTATSPTAGAAPGRRAAQAAAAGTGTVAAIDLPVAAAAAGSGPGSPQPAAAKRPAASGSRSALSGSGRGAAANGVGDADAPATALAVGAAAAGIAAPARGSATGGASSAAAPAAGNGTGPGRAAVVASAAGAGGAGLVPTAASGPSGAAAGSGPPAAAPAPAAVGRFATGAAGAAATAAVSRPRGGVAAADDDAEEGLSVSVGTADLSAAGITARRAPEGDGQATAAALPPARVAAAALPAEGRVRDVAAAFARRNPAGRGSDPQANPDAGRARNLVDRGLEFLARSQRDDGRWSLGTFAGSTPADAPRLRSDTAATGLALLSFLGAGHDHFDGPHRDAVRRGLEFLLAAQQPDGDLYLPADELSNSCAWLYSHGIAAIALCEAVGMTGDPRIKPAAERACGFIAASQHPTRGGWRYTPRSDADLSVSGWMLVAVRSGELGGVKTDPRTLAGVRTLLEAAAAPADPGRYAYNPRKPEQRMSPLSSACMTAVGGLMRLHTGAAADDPRVVQAARVLTAIPPEYGTASRKVRDAYLWYYASQVLVHTGGPEWRGWYGRLVDTLAATQETSGPMAGSWDPLGDVPDRWGLYGGRIYVTALHLLALEVPDRHLPTYSAGK